MATWLSKLFGLCPETPKEVKPKRQRRDKLNDVSKNMLVTDRNINQMTLQSISKKYGISESTVRKYLKEASRR